MRFSCLLLSLLGSPIAALAAATGTVYQIQTVAGSGCTNGGPGASTAVGTPNGVAVDASGNLYFSDTDNHLVRKVDTKGTMSTIAGTCAPGYSGDGGPAAAAQLNQPYGVAVDAAGNVYVADYGNNRVRKIATDGTISTVAGNGQQKLAGDGVPAASSPIMTPRNVAVDANGNLYISEFQGHRVRKLAPNGTIATTVGIGIAGYGGDAGAATAAQLNFPAGLAVDRAGALYIADSGNHRVRRVANGVITSVLGPTVSGTTPLFGPVGVAIDASGTIYVAQGISAGSAAVGTYNTVGQWAAIAIAAGSGASADDVALDANGNLYIAAGKQVWEKTLAGSGGAPSIIAGGASGIGDGGNATSAQLSTPWAVTLDVAGNLYIADAGHQRVRKVSATGQISTVAGTGASGSAGDGGPASAAQLASPFGVALDNAGNLYIADTTNQRIREVGLDSTIHTVMGTGQSGVGGEGLPGTQMPLTSPRGVCTGAGAALYVVDLGNHRVLRMAGGAGVTTAAGNGSQGNAGDGGPARLAELNGPSGCALDAAGDLFIADTGNNAIRKVTPDGNISTVAGTGTAGFSGDGGPATAANLNGPTAISTDGNGDLYISDTSNSRIRMITPDGLIHTVAGGTNGPAITRPGGLVLDGSGNLYFAEPDSNLVVKLVPGTPTGTGPADGGSSQPLSTFSAANAASLSGGPVAPGELIAITGTNLGPQTGVTGTLNANGLMPTNLSGTEVDFDGTAAPLLYAQAGQINVQVPYGVANEASTNVVVLANGQKVGTLALPVASTAPAIFSAIANPDGSVNSQSNPVAQNSIVTLYATGEGLTNGPNTSGQPASAPYPQPVAPVSLTIGGLPASILFAGSAPGVVGVLQVNARTPGGFAASGQSTAVLTVGSVASPPATIWLQ